MNIVFCVMFLLAVIGYMLSYTAYVKKDLSFFPLLFIAVSSIVTFFFGLAGLLKAGPYVVVISGLLLLGWSLYKKVSLRALVHPACLFMLVGVIWAFVITRGVGLSQLDDFNHWYKICKIMHAEGAFPTTPDIDFPTYTPGTALWIYQITRCTGFSVANCFFAQSVLNLAGCCCLISAIRSEDKWGVRITRYVIACVASVFLCSLDMSTYNLLVDCSLGLVALYVAVYLLRYSFSFDYYVLVPVLVYLRLIKMSGILFCVFLLGFYLLGKKRLVPSSIGRSTLWVCLSTVAVPFAMGWIYKFRMSFYYSDIGGSNQAFSLQRFTSIGADKSPELIRSTAAKVWIEAFSFVNGYPQILAVWVFFLILFVFVFAEDKKKECFSKYILGYLFGFYIVYTAFMTFTYIFSMDSAEATYLASYFRYMGTPVVVITGIAIYIFLDKFVTSKVLWSAAFTCVMLAINIWSTGIGYIFGISHYVPMEDYTDSAWKAISSYVPESFTYSPGNYVVIWNNATYDADGAYAFKYGSLSSVYLRCVDAKFYSYAQVASGSEAVMDDISSADYIVVVGEADESISVLSSYTSSGEIVSGINPAG